MNIGWPEAIYLGLWLLGQGAACVRWGRKHDVTDLWTSLLAAWIGLGLIWWGGFFA